MTEKQSKLERVKVVSEQYEEAQRTTEQLREHLASVAYEATQHHATQQEIADQTQLSRQRIQQLLTEVVHPDAH